MLSDDVVFGAEGSLPAELCWRKGGFGPWAGTSELALGLKFTKS
jgi:hypothetical protein